MKIIKKIIELIETKVAKQNQNLANAVLCQDWQGARDVEIFIHALERVLHEVRVLQDKQDAKREKAEALARESASQIDPNYRHPNFGAMNYDLTPHLTAQYQDEKGSCVLVGPMGWKLYQSWGIKWGKDLISSKAMCVPVTQSARFPSFAAFCAASIAA